jgi:hypothetical protein
MNTAEFFMANFGRHFLSASSGDTWADVEIVLRGSYPLIGKSTSSRMQSGWAIVRPGSATLQLDLNVPDIQKSRMTRNEAFVAELDTWQAPEPRIFMMFEKAPIALAHLFMSVDKRQVRICTPAGAKTEDWVTTPPRAKAAKQ